MIAPVWHSIKLNAMRKLHFFPLENLRELALLLFPSSLFSRSFFWVIFFWKFEAKLLQLYRILPLFHKHIFCSRRRRVAVMVVQPRRGESVQLRYDFIGCTVEHRTWLESCGVCVSCSSCFVWLERQPFVQSWRDHTSSTE